MDYGKWQGTDWKAAPADVYDAFQADMVEDLKAQLTAHGIELRKVLPNVYQFAAVAATAQGDRFLYIAINDVREDADWMANVRVRRMSSERDWKGESYHSCTWDGVGEAAAHYLTDAFDGEVL